MTLPAVPTAPRAASCADRTNPPQRPAGAANRRVAEVGWIRSAAVLGNVVAGWACQNAVCSGAAGRCHIRHAACQPAHTLLILVSGNTASRRLAGEGDTIALNQGWRTAAATTGRPRA